MSNSGEEVLISDVEASDLRTKRRQADLAVSSYCTVFRPGASRATDIYRCLIDSEERLAPSGDYAVGSAAVDDELLILYGLNRVLLTAEHATDHVRAGASKEADFGTGALAEVVAEQTSATAIIARGRQTGDANYEPQHPLKDAMAEVVADPVNKAHLSLHLLYRGRELDPRAELGYSVVLGLGDQPSAATKALADEVIQNGKNLGLRVGINTPHLVFDGQQLRRNSDGSLRTVTFAAKGPNTTRAYAQAIAQDAGKVDGYATMQLEINEALLVRAGQELEFPSQNDRELGAYVGYLLVNQAVGAVALL